MNGNKELLVLKTLFVKNRPYKATELSEILGIPPSTIYNTLYRLANDDYVMKTNDGYWLVTEKGKYFLRRLYEELKEVFEVVA